MTPSARAITVPRKLLSPSAVRSASAESLGGLSVHQLAIFARRHDEALVPCRHRAALDEAVAFIRARDFSLVRKLTGIFRSLKRRSRRMYDFAGLTREGFDL
jgi:hypothetical protein